ncbi:MAG: NADH-quinone oxidoreductase subunit A, partial [bacterium]
STVGDYSYVLVFFIAAIIFGLITLFLSRLLQPHRPYPAKETTYECGEMPVGIAWVQFNISYYIFALIFVIFDVETVFIYPWAVVMRMLKDAGVGVFGVIEMTVFILILVLGLVYAWKKGVLRWV